LGDQSVDDEKAQALRAIDAALRTKGFVRDWEFPGPRYCGELDTTGLRIPVSIEIQDTDFIRAPVIKLSPHNSIGRKPIAHITGPEGTLCYLDTRATVLDRYDPTGTVLRCLLVAEQVLGDALRGRSNQDFAAEFLSYWSTQNMLIDLPAGFAGKAVVQWLGLQGDDHVMPILSASGTLAPTFARAHRDAHGMATLPPSDICWVASVNESLTLDPDGLWPPADIAALKDWLEMIGTTAGQVLDRAILAGEGMRRWIAIKAANGCAIAMIKIPAIFNRPEFLANRRSSLLPHLLRVAAQVSVSRYRGLPVDESYLYSRNLGDLKSLAAKNIALIGCGTIGGFLANQLAQSGAGSCRGRLQLFDDEALMPGNLGRHLLGVRDLGRNKAEACRDLILSNLPHLDVGAEPENALQYLDVLSRCSLVIDTTGEEAFSIALNHHAIRRRPHFPPVLYVWLAGNGAIAQSLLCDGPGHACYKCMKPKLTDQPRYRAVRSDTEMMFDRNLVCGDGLFAPFPVSRAASAAALGLEAALGWINSKPEPRFRNRLFDPERALNVKDGNPAPSAACPECRTPAP
jgi:molybdopterin/thiamine biosynthesis adenylyltransferase